MPGELPVFGISATTVVEKAPPEDEVPAFDFHFQGVGTQAQRKGYLSLQLSQQNESWTELTRLTIRSAEKSFFQRLRAAGFAISIRRSGVIAEARAKPLFLPIAAAASSFPRPPFS